MNLFVSLGRRRCLNAVMGAALASLSACSVPNHMHVTQGIAPANVDTNVRFRTTYYLRVFDYCPAAGTPGATVEAIPETDVIYRYRMTGKASALANKIRFEAGTLSAAQIDPFGSSVRHDAQTGKFVLEPLSGDPARAPETEPQPASGLGQAPPNSCSDGSQRARGFMIMGPEGMMPYAQNSRLVLAMHSSADPLIATLQEYSGRLLAAKVEPAEQLLPLVQENMRALEAQRALDQLAARTQGVAALTIDQVADTAVASFGEGATKP